MSRVIVVGAGINGVTAAIELRRRGHDTVLLDPGPLPHPLAASTDISKAVRAAYGADEEYTDLAEHSIKRWHEWTRRERGSVFLHGIRNFIEMGFWNWRQAMQKAVASLHP